MDNGTDAWVIVVAAFGGGLAGAVLQPALTHILELIRASATIRKRREQSLRKMLMIQIREGRQFLAKSGNFELSHQIQKADEILRKVEAEAMDDCYKLNQRIEALIA